MRFDTNDGFLHENVAEQAVQERRMPGLGARSTTRCTLCSIMTIYIHMTLKGGRRRTVALSVGRRGCKPALPRCRPRSPRKNASACCRPQPDCRGSQRDCGCSIASCDRGETSCRQEDPCRDACFDSWDSCGSPSACQRNPCNLPRGDWMPVCRPSPQPCRPCRPCWPCPQPCLPSCGDWKHVKHCKRPEPCPPCPCPPRPLRIRKVDAETCAPLACATFRLRGTDESLQVETSREDGWLCFEVRPCVRYVLAEICPPPGYEQSNLILEIVVDEWGCFWVDGSVVECLCIPNVRLLT